jgi:hypothetical protein
MAERQPRRIENRPWLAAEVNSETIADLTRELEELHERAAAAIALAEERATTALRAARETVRWAQIDERRMRAELDVVTEQKVDLATRLALCEQTLRERERELERERKLADEATRWASRVESELVLGTSPAPPADADVAATAAADPPMSTPRRREPRVRVRHAS